MHQQGVLADLCDADAFSRFCEANLPRIYGYFVTRCGGRTDIAGDLTQETFLAAAREVKLGRTVEDPASWVAGIARHKLVDHYRRRSREERTLARVIQVRSLPVSEPGADRVDLLAALAKLPNSQRLALTLRYVDGLSVGQAAALMRRSVAATESLIARGKESLRQHYGSGSDD